jgi:hypothetical protein
MEFNRRHFLAGLISVGAAIALPIPLAQAKLAQVNAAWAALLEDPWYFEVDAADTITTAGVKEPERRRDVFDADLTDQCTVDSLIDDIEACWPLNSHFQKLAADELAEVESSLEDPDDLTDVEHSRLQCLQVALGDELEGWADWMRLEGTAGLQRFKDEVVEWLASDIEYNDYEWLPRSAGAQGSALEFFESLPVETLKVIGVVIIEGEHPGSTYFAAELHTPIDDANSAAKALGLPFQFCTQP